jgi:hypothetical protein
VILGTRFRGVYTLHSIEIGPNQPSAVDVTVGFPCVTPGSAKEWHCFGLGIRVYAMRYPEGSGPSLTGFFLPKGFAAGLRLERCGADLWNAFVRAHAHAQLNGSPEMQMDYFTRAIESLLAQGAGFDEADLKR